MTGEVSLAADELAADRAHCRGLLGLDHGRVSKMILWPESRGLTEADWVVEENISDGVVSWG